MKLIKQFLPLLLCCILLGSACVSTDASFTRVAPGQWRGVLELEKYRVPFNDKDSVSILYDQFKPGELPFNFEITYIDDEHFYMEIINGTERIRLDSIQYGRDKTQARDTMNVWFPEYQSYIHAEIRGGVMQGKWVVTTKDNYSIPFYAHAGRGYRFTSLQQKPDNDLSGNWAVLFGIDEKEQDKAIAEFKQVGNQLSGTFRTETGDYRYLDGTVQGRKFFLSCFDGAHAFLFSGSVRNDTLNGEFRSGKHHRALWQGWKDPNFALGNADTLTKIKSGGDIKFNVQTPDNKNLVFPGPAFDQKIKIFTITGTWCPNCKDEQGFLRDYIKANPTMADQLAVVGFSFERNKTPESANAHLREYKRKMNLPFDLVYAGNATTAEAAKFFPALDKVMAFPTMIILDKNNQVRMVHTGFDGPATSKHAAFKAEFESLLKSL